MPLIDVVILCHKYSRISWNSKGFRLTYYFPRILFVSFFLISVFYPILSFRGHYSLSLKTASTIPKIFFLVSIHQLMEIKQKILHNIVIFALCNSSNKNFFCFEHLSSCCINYSLNISFSTDPRVSWYITHSLFYFQTRQLSWFFNYHHIYFFAIITNSFLGYYTVVQSVVLSKTKKKPY